MLNDKTALVRLLLLLVTGFICLPARLMAAESGGLPPAASETGAPGASGMRLAQNTYVPPWEKDAEPPRQIRPRRDTDGAQDGNNAGPPPQGQATGPNGRDVPPAQNPDGPPDDPQKTYSSNEILGAGHRFFGNISRGLASVVEYAFSRQGRPNGYILGEEAGGAVIAGVRYGEGTLYTKFDGVHKVYWQGPSVGYDLGAEGSKTLILVYNLLHVDQIYARFGGIDGSAYLVGGAGITFQRHDGVTLAPIRSGVGLRLGANVGYLKYTREPTWNPF